MLSFVLLYQLSFFDICIFSIRFFFSQGYEVAKLAIEASLTNLDLQYVDLYLIHWPGTSKLQVEDPQNAVNRRGSWLAMEEAYTAGME